MPVSCGRQRRNAKSPAVVGPLVALTQRNGPSTGAGWGHHSSDALGGKGIRSWINKQRRLLSFRLPGWLVRSA
jgi:hypothetical protein